jgi:hypothetical protein
MDKVSRRLCQPPKWKSPLAVCLTDSSKSLQQIDYEEEDDEGED